MSDEVLHKPAVTQDTCFQCCSKAVRRDVTDNNCNTSAFSLIELAVVIVIIGLLVGVVMVGQALLTHTELKRIVSDAERYSTAVHAFRLKHNCLPGDCANATSYFSFTINGDGDGMVETSPNERIRVWEQLSGAGMLEGEYRYVSGLNEGQAIGVYFPKGIRDAGVLLTYGAVFQESRNDFRFGGYDPGASGLTDGFLTSQEALSIDQKYDDGRPSYGRIKASRSYSGTGPAGTRCVSSSSANSPVGVTYVTTSTDTCGMFFRL